MVKIPSLPFSSHSLCLPPLNLSHCLSTLSLFLQYSDKFWQADLEAEDKSIHHLTAVSWSPQCERVCVCECVYADKIVCCCCGYCIHYTFLFPSSLPHTSSSFLFKWRVSENQLLFAITGQHRTGENKSYHVLFFVF